MTQEPRREVDLTAFKQLGPAGGALEDERARLLQRRFPSLAALRWEEAFDADPDMLGRVLRDILKEANTEPGHRGPRFGLDWTRDMPALDRLRGIDPSQHPYSLLAFAETFGLLMGKRSVRHTASKLGWPPAKVHRLRRGEMVPTLTDLEHIASRFDHHPGYFLEYRTWAIQEALSAALGRQPEVSIGFYERLWQWSHRHVGGSERRAEG